MNREIRGKRSGFPFGAVALLALLAAGSCKFGSPSYSLDVVIETGVAGSPAAGKHTFQELTTVSLSYIPVDPLETVEVILNGTLRFEGTGSFIMYGDGYNLKVGLLDVRGAYKVTLTYTNPSVPALAPFIITLTGPNRLSGPFTDDRPDGFQGTWTSNADTLSLAYWNWDFYVLSITAFNFGYGTGTFTGNGYTGSWTAVKQ